MNSFTTQKLVRFQHCDPGGIVFTPQYFNLFVEVLEDWWAHIGYSFHNLVIEQRHGLPAMHIDAHFRKPTFLNDTLDFSLHVKRLRETHAQIHLHASCRGEERCYMDFLYGSANVDEKKLTPWPPGVRDAMAAYLRES